MNPLLLTSVLEIGKTMLDRWFPDPEKKAAAELELLKLTQDDDLKRTLAQLEINAKEAVSPSLFVSGWRPFFGWCSGAGFLYATIGQPLITWYGASRGWAPPPEINVDLLWVVATGMLGIGGMRTFEKKVGATK